MTSKHLLICITALITSGVVRCSGSLPQVTPDQGSDSGPSSSGGDRCDDKDPCTLDRVNPETQKCVHSPVAAGGSCSDGEACTYDDKCNANGKCVGTAITCTDDTATCGAKRTCDGTSKCAEAFTAAGTVCTGGCMKNGQCDGKGACTGGTPQSCPSDVCHTRACDEATGECKVTKSHGKPVFEAVWGEAWSYAYTKAAGAKVAFRVLAEDKTLYQLEATGISQRMLSLDPSEANTCDWCQCVSQCAFHDTGETIKTASLPQTGMVELKRYVDKTWKRIRHRTSAVDLGSDYIVETQSHGYVCAVEK